MAESTAEHTMTDNWFMLHNKPKSEQNHSITSCLLAVIIGTIRLNVYPPSIRYMNIANRVAMVIIFLLSLITVGILEYASAFVNIVSPSKGDAVPAGSSLTVTGTSDDNAQTNCNIQILVNDHRPYQDTIPVAPGDYSDWTFVVNPQYAEIEEGINTITSKALCDTPHEPFLKLDPLMRQYVKHYSINVTGVPSGLGADSEEPFIFTAPGEDSGDGVDETEGEQDGDEESTSDESVFE